MGKGGFTTENTESTETIGISPQRHRDTEKSRGLAVGLLRDCAPRSTEFTTENTESTEKIEIWDSGLRDYLDPRARIEAGP